MDYIHRSYLSPVSVCHSSNKGGLWLVPRNISLFSTKAYVPALIRDLVRKFFQVIDHDLIVIEYSKKLCQNEYQTLCLIAALIFFFRKLYTCQPHSTWCGLFVLFWLLFSGSGPWIYENYKRLPGRQYIEIIGATKSKVTF